MKRLVKETLFGSDISDAQRGRHYQGDTLSMPTTIPTAGTTQTTVIEQKTFVEQPTVLPTTTAETTTFLEQPATKILSTPVSVEKIEKNAVVQEVIKPGTREEIQPIVHREREQLEIKKLLQPVYENDIRPTIVEERQLAAEYRPEVRIGTMPSLAEAPRSTTFTEVSKLETIVKPPIVQETIRRKIIEEIQPVIYRQVIAPRVIKEVKPIYERVVEAPVVSYETLPARYSSGSEYLRSEFTPVSWTTTTTTSAPISTGGLTQGMSDITSVPLSSSTAPISTGGLAQGMSDLTIQEGTRGAETVTPNVHYMSAAAPEFVPTSTPLAEETITTTTSTITEPVSSSTHTHSAVGGMTEGAGFRPLSAGEIVQDVIPPGRGTVVEHHEKF